MSDFLFAVNATAPVFLAVLLGYLLKRIGLLSVSLSGSLNKLVFRVFLPAMLFLNVYKIENLSTIEFPFIGYALGMTVMLFALGFLAVICFCKEKSKRGVLLQAIFRGNFALVGIPITTALFGEMGAMLATVLSAFLVPLFNLLAIVALSAFSSDKKFSLCSFAVKTAKNPLIISIALGFVALGVRALFVRFGISFRLTDITPLYNTLSSLSAVATPLALIALGGQFEFSAIASLRREITFGVLCRCVVVPLLGIGLAFLFPSLKGAHFAVFIAAFCTPVAVSSVPMAQEMDGDAPLAGQLVVFTTLISAFTIFFASYILKLIGIF